MNDGHDTPCTILSVTGLFVIGITLILSGVIVLYQQREAPFLVAGSLFTVTGIISISFCGVIQRNEIMEYLLELGNDPYCMTAGTGRRLSS